MLLSIIIPIYNVEKYLPRCLDSVFDQDFSDYEVILVDDGSTDSSGVIADEYAAKMTDMIPVNIFHKKNGGLSSARNLGLKNASGKYVWFIDSDDMIEEEAFEILSDELSREPDLLAFSIRSISDQGTTSHFPVVKSTFYSGNDFEQIKGQIISKCTDSLFTAWMHVYKRELIRDMEFISEREFYIEDIAFNLIIYQKAKSLNVINDFLYDYIIREGSLVHSSRHILIPMVRAYHLIKDEYQKMGLWDRYQENIFSSIVDGGILGAGANGKGALLREYLLSDSRQEAHDAIMSIIFSPDFIEMVDDTKKHICSEKILPVYEALRSGDEEKLCDYYIRLIR